MASTESSGYLHNLNDQQAQALEEMKVKTKHVEYIREHPEGDAYLLRFLRATMSSKVKHEMRPLTN